MEHKTGVVEAKRGVDIETQAPSVGYGSNSTHYILLAVIKQYLELHPMISCTR